MNNRCYKNIISIFFLLFSATVINAQKQITVFAGKPLATVSPNMWGIFFEDINFAADGGLYAELVKNRSFEFSNPLMGWKEIKPQGTSGKLLMINAGDKNPANPRYATITVNNDLGYGLSNEGFRGMGIQKDKQYLFFLSAKKNAGDVKIKIELVNVAGVKIGEASLAGFSDQWKKYSVKFSATGTDAKAHLNIFFEGSGNLDVDNISLFPKDTWKNRLNGLRSDLVQMLADLKPGFLRFPGGCIVEGHELETRYQWKKTIGDPDARQLMINRWNTEMRNRQAPDYFQSFGLGFYEYFQLAEDIGASPLPILNCGMACQFNTKEVVPLNQLDPYIQDALDLVEFANGSANTKWGKLRAELGHPAPFNLKMLGVGNEQWDEQYIDRYKAFEKVFLKKHPEIKLVAAAGPDPDGQRFDYAWKEFKKLSPSFIDEHYYKSPQWFFDNANRYDNYNRTGLKVFAGEYAAHGKEDKESESKNTWLSALAEAAFMTGLERNADVVQMASYAPLFAHVEAWQWRPDLIWFDNLNCVGTPNYYVQKMFSNNKGTNVVAVLLDGKPLEGKDSIYASAVIDRTSNEVVIKMVNSSSRQTLFQINIDGVKTLQRKAAMQMLSSQDQLAFNTITVNKKIYPVEQMIDVNKNNIQVMLSSMSVNVLRIKYAK
ncbi:MAG TPA: alpha-L-arabinofuranosidase C-terminal domain-containing protein [Chitinophagaceae bacterium]